MVKEREGCGRSVLERNRGMWGEGKGESMAEVESVVKEERKKGAVEGRKSEVSMVRTDKWRPDSL